MRIVGGEMRGRALAGPKGDGGAERLRPTSDRVREAIFNRLAHGDYTPLEGARVLDLFAGTGALGIEALSRGAARALFVDDGAEARALIRQNTETLGLIGKTKLYRRNATRLGENRGEPYTLVFLDPPYGRGLGAEALTAAVTGGWLAEGATVVLESDAAGEQPPAAFEICDDTRYGETRVMLLRFSAS